MDRRTHTLHSTTGNTYPTNWIAVDFAIRSATVPHGSQTVPLELVGVSAIACRVSKRENTCTVVKDFTPQEDFWAWVATRLRRNSATWLISMQSMLLLDLTKFWDCLEDQVLYMTQAERDHANQSEEEYKKPWEGFAVTEDPPTIVVVRHPQTGGSLKIVDARNYGIQSWSDLCDRNNGQPDFWPSLTDDNKSLVQRAQERADVLNRFVTEVRKVLSKYGFGSLQATAASQALYTFKRKYLRDLILIDGRDEIHDFEGKAYFSGRNEARRLGRIPGPVVHLDVNSHYLACTVDNPVPVKYVGTVTEINDSNIPDLIVNNLVIADVTVNTLVPRYPYRDDHDVIYPIGSFRTTLCGPELTPALINGDVKLIHKIQIYEGRRIFELWSDGLWNLRKELKSNGLAWGSTFIKRVAVSLFGKLGQRSRGWVDRPEIATPYPFKQWVTAGEQPNTFRTYRALAWRTQELTDRGWAWDSFPAISAFVTSYGRAYLWYLLNMVGLQHVWYYDTDSIWCSPRGLENAQDAGLVKDDQLGKLKLVEVVDEMEIFGLKNYRAGERRVCAGASRRLTEYLGPGGIGVTVAKLGESLKIRSRPSGSVNVTPPQELVQYKHGEVQANGSILPICLPRIEF